MKRLTHLPQFTLVAAFLAAAPAFSQTVVPTAPFDSVELEGGQDLIWYYPDPLPEVARIKDLVCFFNEKVDIELDGEAEERPETPWSKPVKSVA